MTDRMEQIAAEREAARAALASTEAQMKADSGDARAFARARKEHQAAIDALERLDWAERAELERQEAEQAQAKRDRLREVQGRAAEAHAEADRLAAELAEAVGKVVEVARRLDEAQGAVNVGVNHETFAVRDGLLTRATIDARVRVDRDAALTTLRVGRELCRLAGMSAAAAESQAASRRL